MSARKTWWLPWAMVAGPARCGEQAIPPPESGIDPSLPMRDPTLLPTLIARGSGGEATPATEHSLTAFDSGLAHQRWLFVLPDGHVPAAAT